MKKNDIVEIEIDNISNDGNAVGHLNGKAIFVPHGAVGDFLKVRIVKDNKNYAFGRIEEITKAGAGRQEVDCPIAQTCGGCCFRHLTYGEELNAKQQFVQDAIRRIAKINIQALPIIPSPLENRYRNKVQVPVALQNSEWVYGFYANRSHRIVECDDCLLQPKEINNLVKRCAQLLTELGCSAYDEVTHTGLVRHIYIRQGGHSKEILLCIVATKNRLPNQSKFIETLLQEFPEIKTIILNVNLQRTNVILGKENHVLFGNGFIQDSLCDVPVRIGTYSFSQVNTLGAEVLFSVAKEYAALSGVETLLDLYCGSGIIGLSMAKKCQKLIGVEIVPEAIASAKNSAKKMKLTNVEFLCDDAASAATKLANKFIRPDVILVDPPRKGCDEETLKAILQMAPSRIVMVSCNPATMARDVHFLYKNNYSVKKIQPVDLFPRTKHVESVVLLSKM